MENKIETAIVVVYWDNIGIGGAAILGRRLVLSYLRNAGILGCCKGT